MLPNRVGKPWLQGLCPKALRRQDLHNEGAKMRIVLLAETPETRSLLGRGTWPQLMCCALVAVRVPEVGRGRVGASEQGGSSDDGQDK